MGKNHGPPIVLFHGVLRLWRDFSPLLADLSLRHHLYLMDFRGHGDSTHDRDGGYRVVDYVQDAVQLVQEIVPKPAILYGHSLGAMVAAAVAARRPDCVSSVILEDPPFETMGSRIHETPLGSYFRHVQQLASTQQGEPIPSLAAALAEIPLEGRPGMKLGDIRDAASLRFSAACLRQIDPRVLQPIVDAQWLTEYDFDFVFNNLSVPVLTLQADTEAGGMLTDHDAQRLQQQLADCTLIRFPNTGHLIHWTQRNALLQHLHGFLESIR